MDELTKAVAPPQIPALLERNDDALDALHDRIDVVFSRTDGVRVPRPVDPTGVRDADITSRGYVLDSIDRQGSRIWLAVQRLETLLDELEV